MEWFKRKKKDDTKVNNREFKELFDEKMKEQDKEEIIKNLKITNEFYEKWKDELLYIYSIRDDGFGGIESFVSLKKYIELFFTKATKVFK